MLTEVRDTVLQIMPSMLRVFTSSDEAVSFEPRTEQDVATAEQATDAVNYAIYNDNDGFTVLHNAFKDAFVRKIGVLKWYWDDSVEVYEVPFTGLDAGQRQVLISEPDTQVVEDKEYLQPVDPALQAQADQQMAAQGMAPQPLPPTRLYDMRVKRVRSRDRVKVECIPVEEFLVSRVARETHNAPLVAHRAIKTVSDLVAMGYAYDEIVEHAGQGDTFVLNYEAQARNPAINDFLQSPDINDPSAQKCVYTEAYVRIDKDGDGIAELRRVCMIGGHSLYDEIVRDVNMAVICPDPEPHMVIGSSVADQVMDLQLIKSTIARNVMDSLAQSIHPRTAIVEGQVNVDDVLNVETGAIVRMRAPGMVQPLDTPFVGQQALPVLAWLDEVKAKRTGVIPASAGLDPDALQSTTRSAVDAAVMGAQERTEMMARLFAEQGIKPMMRGILRLMCENMDRPRMMRLRGKWVQIDPRSWDADMDCLVRVALGRGTEQSKMEALAGIAQKQEAVIMTAGADNPLVDLSNLRNTYARMTELAGYKDVSAFWKPVDMDAIPRPAGAEPAAAVARADHRAGPACEGPVRRPEGPVRRPAEAAGADAHAPARDRKDQGQRDPQAGRNRGPHQRPDGVGRGGDRERADGTPVRACPHDARGAARRREQLDEYAR